MHISENLRLFRVCAFGIVLLFGVSTYLAAQATVGTILGTVTDSSGATVPGARIQITNAGTGAVQVATADAQGLYRVPALPVGDYDVQAENMGFQTAIRKGVTLTVGSEVVVDFSLTVGQVTQTVTVEAAVPIVETTSSTISNLVEPTQMRELPLNGRDVEQLILLAPGVTIFQGIGQTAANGFGNSYSISGSRTRGMWEIMDDNDITNYQDRNAGSGVLGTSLGIDAIAEFEILTNTYSAQYGGNGGVVNSVTKSGTNNFHGSAYEFFRNSALDARNFFDPATIPVFQKNQFGATLGGPIKKDKMFFFVNYEGLRQNTGEDYGYAVPDDAAHLGYTPNAAGVYTCVNAPAIIYPNPSCAATIPAAIQQYLPYFPLPSLAPNVSPDVNGLVTDFESMQAPGNENYVVGRYDWTISSKDSIFARYVYDKGFLFEANGGPTLSPAAPTGWATNDTSKNQFLSIEEKHIWSTNVITSTRGGYSRTFLGTVVPTSENYSPVFQQMGTNTYGFQNPPLLSITLTPLVNAVTAPRQSIGGGSNSTTIQNKTSGGEDIYWNKGAHALRFGASIERDQTYKFAPPAGGTWTFANVTSLLEESPSNFSGVCETELFASCAAAGLPPTVVSPLGFRQNTYGFYIQDDWKVRSNLTVNIGLRYEPQSDPWNAYGPLYVAENLPLSAQYNPLLPMPGCVVPTAIAPVNCPPLSGGQTGYTPIHNIFLTNPTYHNFDPRIGLAWDPFKDHKTSVRAGYGIFHSPLVPFDFTMGFTNTPQGTSVLQSCSGVGAAGTCSTFPVPFQAKGSFSPSLDGGIDPGDKQNAYMQQWNLTIQHQIVKNTILSIGYVGSRGVHLQGDAAENPPLPTGVPGAITVPAGKVVLPYPAVGQFLTGGAPAAPTSATGQPIVDPTTGQLSYANVMCTAVTLTGCSVVANNRIDPDIGFWNVIRTTYSSHYNALDAGLVRRLTNNLQGQISYTYASCITNSSGTNGLEGEVVGEDAYNVNADTGNCDFLVRHNLYINGMYVLPFKGNRLVTGWQLSGIFQYHTGTPMWISDGWGVGQINRSGSQAANPNRPDLVPGCTPTTGNEAAWINLACFVQAPVGEDGNLGMNTVFGPDSMTFDTSIVKNTQISERFNVQFRAEFFNIFNRPNFRNSGQPSIPIYQQATPLPASCATTPQTCDAALQSAGEVTETNTTSRQIQFGVKLIF